MIYFEKLVVCKNNILQVSTCNILNVGNTYSIILHKKITVLINNQSIVSLF